MIIKLAKWMNIQQTAGLKTALVAVFALFAFTTVDNDQADAQEVLQKIEVLVNDQVISAWDVRQRLGLIIASTGGVRTQEELDRLREQVIDTMINERLQLQEARQFELEAPESELESTYNRIATSFTEGNGDDFEAFLRQYGASKETLMDQIRAEYVWQMLVNGRLGSQITITDEEVADTLDRLKANEGKFEYRLSEIYFIVDDPSRDAEVREVAQRISEQAKQGGNILQLARQFSQSATAAKGGDMGWLSEDTLMPEIYEAISNLSVGGVTDPIQTPGGYYVIGMTDRRRILSVDPLDVTLSLKQVFWAFTEQTQQDDVVALLEKIDAIRENYNQCDQVDQFAADVGGNGIAMELGDIALRQLNVQLRSGLENLSIGQNSKPIATNEGVRVFFVCGREEPTVRIPTEDDIYSQLEQQRLAMMSRRYLRDLRRDAIIDYR